MEIALASLLYTIGGDQQLSESGEAWAQCTLHESISFLKKLKNDEGNAHNQLLFLNTVNKRRFIIGFSFVMITEKQRKVAS